MVDAVISFVVNKIGDYLIHEAVRFQGVKREVESLKNELEWMQCFLKDAERKQVDDLVIRKWVSDIRDVAYDIEDVLDTFTLNIEEEEAAKRRTKIFASIKKFSSICSKDSTHERSSHTESSFFSIGEKAVNQYNIGKKIEEIRQKLADISRKREQYRLEDIGNNSERRDDALYRLKVLRRDTSFVVEGRVVGFEDDAEELLAKLLDGEPRRGVISIFGMGGLGKTTLAKKLYHNYDVKKKFSDRAWVSVSQDYRIEDILRRIIKSSDIMLEKEDDPQEPLRSKKKMSIKELKREGQKLQERKKKELEREQQKIKELQLELEKMSQEDLERYLRKSWSGRSYLLVIDDVWQKDAWESLKRAFPDNNNGSRVIITTRDKEVAERSDENVHVHKLRFLNPVESWKLFCDKAFQNSNADEGLKKLGREMVEKCRGLPLAIVVLGGLLSTKKPHEWRRVHHHIWQHIRDDSNKISFLLDLSFNDLSYDLKLSFLYLSLFPEDFEIHVEKLIRLLMAEGFIQENEGQIMEEEAESHLKQLINRSLVQIEKICWGRIATCRVHDLLRDLAIEKAKESNFAYYYDATRHSTPPPVILSCRNQAIYSDIERRFQHYNQLSRSFLFFDQKWDESLVVTKHLPPLFTRFRLLRVLDVEGSKSKNLGPHGKRSLPQEIGNLIHLKYLGLRNACIYYFPSSFVKLKRLQTLDIFCIGCIFDEIPVQICKLRELKHLIGNFRGPHRFKNFQRVLLVDNLTKLQTLKYISTKYWSKINPEKLANLRELRIESDVSPAEEFDLEPIGKLKSLQILSVTLNGVQSFASWQALAHCTCLVDLRLSGKIEKLPRNMEELLPNLECLKLSGSILRDDPMAFLEKLPNLMVLVLKFTSYGEKKMISSLGGFPRLEILQVEFYRVVEWQVHQDSMPMLKSLKIQNVSMYRIPERLRSIPPPAEWECADGSVTINNTSYFQP